MIASRNGLPRSADRPLAAPALSSTSTIVLLVLRGRGVPVSSGALTAAPPASRTASSASPPSRLRNSAVFAVLNTRGTVVIVVASLGSAAPSDENPSRRKMATPGETEQMNTRRLSCCLSGPTIVSPPVAQPSSPCEFQAAVPSA